MATCRAAFESPAFGAALLIPCLLMVTTGAIADSPPATTISSGSANATVRLQVRVVDSAGKPIAGAAIQVRSLERPQANSNDELKSEIVPFKVKLLQTDSHGVFRTPQPLPAELAYTVEASAAGFVPNFSRWVHPDESGEVTLPDVVLRRLISVKGRVTDRDGKPVAGAKVIQSGDGPKRTEAATDSDGKFAIDGVPEGPAFLFVDKPGFYFTGKRIDASRSAELLISPRTKPNPERLAALPAPPTTSSQEEVRSKAKANIIERAKKAITSGPPQIRSQSLYELADADPAMALQMIEKIPSLTANERDQIRQWAVVKIAETSPDEALPILSLIEDPSWKIYARLDLAEKLPALATDQKLALFGESLTMTRSTADPTNRVYLMSRIAEGLLKLKQEEQAKNLLKEALLVVDGVPDNPTAKSNRGRLALLWAQVDSNEALRLQEQSDPFFCADLAVKLAPKGPAKAEELFGKFTMNHYGPSRKMGYTRIPEICHALAKADLARAKKLAALTADTASEFKPYPRRPISWGEIASSGRDLLAVAKFPVSRRSETGKAPTNAGPTMLKAMTYGFMAHAAAKSSPEEAKKLLREAVDMLSTVREGVIFPRPGFIYTPGLYLAALLPIAEEVDPDLLPEMFWRSLELRLPAEAGETSDNRTHDIALANLAGLLASYDREAAKVVFEPVADRELRRSSSGTSISPWTYLAGLHIDPVRTLQWAAKLSDRPGVTGMPIRQSVEGMLLWAYSSDPWWGKKPYRGMWQTSLGVLWLNRILDTPEDE